jgi:hypothetical protein
MGDWLVQTLLPLFPALGVKRSDVMVLNFAIWINKEQEYRDNIRMFADYYRANKDTLPFIIWRDSSVQHFDTPTGDYECDGCPKPSFPFVCRVSPLFWRGVAFDTVNTYCEGINVYGSDGSFIRYTVVAHKLVRLTPRMYTLEE